MTLTQWYGERWLAQRLGILADYDQGITTTASRRARLADAVAADPTKVVGKRGGKAVTAQEALQALERPA